MAVLTLVVTMLAVNSVLKRGPGTAVPGLLPTVPVAPVTSAAPVLASSHLVPLPLAWQGGTTTRVTYV